MLKNPSMRKISWKFHATGDFVGLLTAGGYQQEHAATCAGAG
jgi:hypothetical protein